MFGLKKFFSSVLWAMMLIFALSVSCFAQSADGESVQQWLEPVQGDWYSTKGNLALSVQNGFINGCSIVDASDLTMGYPRTGTFVITEADQSRSMKLEVFGNDMQQYLLVDGAMALRRSQNEAHFESMGGIYLGMTEEDLLHYYGKPVSKVTEGDQVRWEYEKDKFAVIFKSNIVVGVRVYKGSERHFDRSGLGAADAPEAYAQKYGMQAVPVVPAAAGQPSEHVSIGQGEYFFFTPEYVQLSVYNA